MNNDNVKFEYNNKEWDKFNVIAWIAILLFLISISIAFVIGENEKPLLMLVFVLFCAILLSIPLLVKSQLKINEDHILFSIFMITKGNMIKYSEIEKILIDESENTLNAISIKGETILLADLSFQNKATKQTLKEDLINLKEHFSKHSIPVLKNHEQYR